jgi:hypothetical protein
MKRDPTTPPDDDQRAPPNASPWHHDTPALATSSSSSPRRPALVGDEALLRRSNPTRRLELLGAWVAWLNSQGASDPSTRTLRDRLTTLLDALDRERSAPGDTQQLHDSYDTWLETAGEVGGPEREQDPTQPHPQAWHSNRDSDDEY